MVRSYRSPLRSSTLRMDATISNSSSKNLSMDFSVDLVVGKWVGFLPNCPPKALGGRFSSGHVQSLRSPFQAVC